MDAQPLGDWYIHDESVGLRRSGGWLVTIGLCLAGAGLCVMMMAATTWSGYVPQAALAIAGGLGLGGVGWSQLREADRQRPRLVAMPVGMPQSLAMSRPTTSRPILPATDPPPPVRGPSPRARHGVDRVAEGAPRRAGAH